MYGDIRQIFNDIRSNWGVVAEHYQYARNKFFYREDFIHLLLYSRTHEKLPKTSFIDYNQVFDYYHKHRKKLDLVFLNEEKTLELPYEEIISFIDTPNATIKVVGDITKYQMPDYVKENTKTAFDAFMRKRPKTTNGPVLRVADLHKHDHETYAARLESAGYFDAVHTSLSLDYPLDDDFFNTLRLQDLTADNELPSFRDSLLVNNIGVCSSIVFKRGGYWYFHMMPRNKNMGAYSSMLASVGGGVEPSGQPITELVSYATSEMKRETKEEIGLDLDKLEQAHRAQVIPLAFMRELSRGGQPQFFFLTVLEEVSDDELKRAFKNAPWKKEFRSDSFSNIRSLDDVLSPEFSACLFYGLEYIQKRRKLPMDKLFLS